MKRPTLKIQYDSPVVLTFALLCLLSLVLNEVTGGWTNAHIFSVYRSSLADPLTYLRFFTHVLGHADFTHFFSNIGLFLVLGTIVERHYGSLRLLCCILVTALVSGLVHFIFFPGAALLGASGIVFMMIFLASLTNAKNGVLPVSLVLVALLYLGGEIRSMIFVADNVSRITHIIGGVCGIVCGRVAGKK